MASKEGALARTFDFGETTTTVSAASYRVGLLSPGVAANRAARAGRTDLRLAVPGRLLQGPDKYQVLEHRRRQAQITARRMLDLFDSAERRGSGQEGR